MLRALVVLALLGLSIYRITRAFRRGVGHARHVMAAPPAIPGVVPAPEHLTAAGNPNASAGLASRVLAGAAGLFVFVAANAVLCVVLFGLPSLGQVPMIWRLFAVIFANFYLVPLAQSVGKKQLQRRQADAAPNPSIQ